MEKTVLKYVIDGNDIWNCFHFGAQEVYTNKKYLNSINVFPVADGDTGTNLATTLRAMVEKPLRDDSFCGMVRGMSDSGLAHARGNSGILFASYINGLASESKIYKVVNKKEFSNIAQQAVHYLYQSIENPVEGTMISVIRDWAHFLFQNHEKYDNFQALLIEAYQTAMVSLLQTTNQQEILKKYKVVDSGADGFVKFLNGINRYFTGSNESEIPLSIPKELIISNDDGNSDSNRYQFCTEVFIDTTRLNATPNMDLSNKIKSQISPYGDSLIVSSQGNKVRVHVHTDTPELVVETLRDYGSFIEQKVDNMYLQSSVKANRLSNIGILTDSIADIPEDFKLDNQIHTLPLGLLLDDSIYLDKLTIKSNQLFKLIDESDTYPTSSQPEPGRVKDFLENLLEIYDSLIFITVSSKMSGTFQTITQVASKLSLPNKKVTVIDSHLNSGAQGLLVKAASDLLKQGHPHDEIVTNIQALIPKTSIYVCLNTLEFAVRSGRVPNTVGKIGIKLGLRPIMTLDKEGNGAAFGVGFSKKSITRKIFRLVENTLKTTQIKAYSIVHADNLELALEYKQELTRLIGKEPEFITEISSIIAIHSGLGCVAVCFTNE